jgi:hypothetical protein
MKYRIANPTVANRGCSVYFPASCDQSLGCVRDKEQLAMLG